MFASKHICPKPKESNNPSHRTAKSGFSLITVTIFGLLATMWISAMLAAVLPVYQKASQSKYYAVARSAAEAGLDYTIDQLNTAIKTGDPSPLDDPIYDAPWQVTTLSSGAIGITGVTVTVTVKNTSPPAGSFLHDPQLDTANPASWMPVLPLPNGWRVVESVATYNGVTRAVRSILRPEYVLLPGSSTPPNPYFPSALSASSSIQLNSGTSTDGYNSTLGPYLDTIDPLGGDVASNTSAALNGTSASPVSVGGSLTINSLPMGSTSTVVAQGTGDPATSVVKNLLTMNGISDGFVSSATPYPETPPADNVLGLSRAPADSTNPQFPSQPNSQSLIAPSAPEPMNAVKAGAVSLSGTATLKVKAGASPLSTSLANVNSGTIEIPPGNYMISSLNVDGSAKIIIDPSVTSSNPFRLFLDGSSGASDALLTSGNGAITNQTSSPSNMQIWYNGSKNINLGGQSDFSGVVYAPNADVMLGKSGSPTQNYYGAFSGKLINATNAFVHFDKALTGGTYASVLSNVYSAEGTSGSNMTLRNLKIASFQEF